jgi:hypothetical protein
MSIFENPPQSETSVPISPLAEFAKAHPKNPKPKKEKQGFKFSVYWLLTTFLIFYAMFSFIWLGVLYAGVDGQKICSQSNFICDIKFPYTKQASVAVNEYVKVSNQATKQKSAKNYIRNIWQEQTKLNDDLVSKQQDVEKALLDYKNYLQNYIRFLNGEPELLKGFDQDEYAEKLTLLEEEIQNLRQRRNENADKKSEAKKQIDQVYNELNERQENTFRENR